MTAVTETPAPESAETPASLVHSAWDLYRSSGLLPWTADLFWARFTLHGLLSTHADTACTPVTGPDEGAIRRAREHLTEVIGGAR